MKKNDRSKRRYRYKIVLEGQVEEQIDKPQKNLHALIQESSVGVQTQMTEKKF